MYCTYCGAKTHSITNCPKTASHRNAMYCIYCGSREHNLRACPKTYAGNAARAWYPDSVADDFIEDHEP